MGVGNNWEQKRSVLQYHGTKVIDNITQFFKYPASAKPSCFRLNFTFNGTMNTDVNECHKTSKTSIQLTEISSNVSISNFIKFEESQKCEGQRIKILQLGKCLSCFVISVITYAHLKPYTKC
jgi:hypothetical protein